MCAEVAQRGSEADAEDGESLLFVSVLSVGHKVNSASGSQHVKKMFGAKICNSEMRQSQQER